MKKTKSKCFDRPSTPQLLYRLEEHLRQNGYASATIFHYLSSVKHFLSWIEKKPLHKNDINPEVMQKFINEHLHGCSCQSPVFKEKKIVRAALNQVLLMEGYERIRSAITITSPEIAQTINSFEKYLKDTCGLSDATRWYHKRHIREFLLWIFKDQHLLISKITPERLCRFVSQKAKTLRPCSVGVLVYSLRIFLKFLKFNGYTVPSLEAKISKPPIWKDTNLAQALTSNEIARFWSAFNRDTANGKRDYAIARCMADLGLRCHEVANIRLDDIDWHTGILHLNKTKNKREEILPIPDEMEQALSSYIYYGRPKSKSRFVFVYHRAPVGNAIYNTTARGAIRRAFCRANLPWTGTHILRSTLASRLFQGGASIKDVADILRHCSIDTTKFYLKIHLSQLAQVALPWPGGQP